MKGFTYYTPTKVLVEENAECQVGTYLANENAKKVLIHYGSERIVKDGLMTRITDSITEAGIEYITLGGVIPNPRLSKVYEGIELCKKENVDFVLAVGGGSVIDSSKAIALGLANDCDVWDFFEKKAQPTKAYPLGCILTLPAAGSEMSTGIVITKEEGGLKRDTGGPCVISKFSLLNPTLTLTIPTKETVNGVVDVMMHTMERYFHAEEDMDITDGIAEGLIKCVMNDGRKLKANPQDLNARTSLMWASSLSHNSLTGCGSNGGDWSTHNIEHEISGVFDVSHGAGLSTVWASWARYVIANIPHRFAKFAINVMGVTEQTNELETGLLGIDAMEKYYKEIGSPTSMQELIGRKATAEEIDRMADSATHFGKRTFGAGRVLDKQDIENILNTINEK